MKLFTGIVALAAIIALAPIQAAAKPSNEQLIIGISQEFDTLNQMITNMVGSVYIGYLVNHPLISIDADWKFGCWLCEEVPSLENGLAKMIKEDGKEKMLVTWTIKEKASWSDGTPVTGHDVAFSWEVGGSPNVKVGEKDTYTKIEAVMVDPKNPKKFILKFKQPRYDHYHLHTFRILPKHIEGPIWEKTKNQTGSYEKQSTYTTNPTHPGLYNGPYRIVELKLSSHVIFERNPHFYGEPAKIKRIISKYIPNTQTLEANLISGTIDMVGELGMTLDQILSFEKRLLKSSKLSKRFEVKYREGMIYEHIDLNLRNPLLQDLRVRQALLYSIDRDTLVTALFDGKQSKALHFLHPKDPYYTDKVARYPFDTKKAAALLDAAGWKRGKDGYRFKNGEKLAFQLMTTAENKTREQVQVFLQQQWKQAGIDITIKNEPARVYFGETVTKAKFPAMAMYAFVAAPDNPPYSTLLSTEIPTEANGYSGQNRPGYVSKTIDDALNKIKREFDFKQRKHLMAIVQKDYAANVPVIPLFLRAEVSVIPVGMKNHRITGHQFYSTLSANEWTFE